MIKPDPIFAAIAANRLAEDALEAAPDEEPAYSIAANAAAVTRVPLQSTVPTTLAGLRAFVEHAEHCRAGDDKIPVEYFPAILAAVRAVLPEAGPPKADDEVIFDACVGAYRRAQARNPGSFSDEMFVARILAVIRAERRP